MVGTHLYGLVSLILRGVASRDAIDSNKSVVKSINISLFHKSVCVV